ncbi:MAG: hypothetical protein ACTTGJ_01410 [Clostridium sp.]
MLKIFNKKTYTHNVDMQDKEIIIKNTNKIKYMRKIDIKQYVLIFLMLLVFLFVGQIASISEKHLYIETQKSSQYVMLPEDKGQKQNYQKNYKDSGGEDPAEGFLSSIKSLGILGVVGGILNGLLGLLTWAFTIIITIFVLAIYLILSVFVPKTKGADGKGAGFFLTPDDIFLNKIPITNLNMFINPDVSKQGGLTAFTESVSVWYRVFYLLAVGILFLVLLYIAINAMIASVSKDIAKVKTMLTDWMASVVILFLLSFIIIATISLNNFLVSVVAKSLEAGKEITPLKSILGEVVAGAFSINFVKQIASLVLLVGLLNQTLAFLYAYIKRTIKVGFLIIIAPLITITYSIDKMKDQKAQALSMWLQEFLQTVLIQPFHVLLYALIAGMTVGMMGTKRYDITYLIMVLITFRFLKEAESMLKSMFQLSKGTSVNDGEKFASFMFKLKLIEKFAKSAEDKNKEENKEEEADGKYKVSNITETGESRRREIEKLTGIRQDVNQNNNQNDNGNNGEYNNNDSGGENANISTQGSNNTINAPTPDKGKLGLALSDKVLSSKGAKFAVKAGLAELGVVTALGSGGGLAEGIAGGVAGFATGNKLIKAGEKANKKHKERMKLTSEYKDKVETEAQELRNKKDIISNVTDLNMDFDTSEGLENFQVYVDNVMDKMQTGDITKEYKEHLNSYVDKLQKDFGLTKVAAEIEAKNYEKQVLAGQVNKDDISSPEQEKFVGSVLEKNMADKISSFNVKYKTINGDYEDVIISSIYNTPQTEEGIIDGNDNDGGTFNPGPSRPLPRPPQSPQDSPEPQDSNTSSIPRPPNPNKPKDPDSTKKLNKPKKTNKNKKTNKKPKKPKK